jgi:glycosyltransferase involved in cell wall biosynthesis
MIALNTARKLNELGIRTYLHVVGIRSLPLQERPDYLIDHGFISKRTLEGRKRMEELLAQCHFLILPTRAEAYGLVICEANAFGMPSLASRTGGIPTIIKDGINGWMFPPEDNGDGYAERISEIWEDPDRYRVLCLSSYNEYRTRLNWDIAGKKIQSLLREI